MQGTNRAGRCIGMIQRFSLGLPLRVETDHAVDRQPGVHVIVQGLDTLQIALCQFDAAQRLAVCIHLITPPGRLNVFNAGFEQFKRDGLASGAGFAGRRGGAAGREQQRAKGQAQANRA